MLQWAKPLWVEVQFLYIIFLPKIGNKKSFVDKDDKNMKACSSKIHLENYSFTN
jgi:hypothetical protein